MKARYRFLRAIGVFRLSDHSDGKSSFQIMLLWPGAVYFICQANT